MLLSFVRREMVWATKVIALAARSMDAGKNDLAAAKRQAEIAGNRILAHFPKWNLWSDAFSGLPADVILKASGWWQPAMVIIGSDTFAVDRLRMSSVSLEIVHRARCSVRIVRFGVADTSGRIQLVIGNSGSAECEAVIHEVAQRHWPEKTQAHIVSVVNTRAPQERGIAPSMTTNLGETARRRRTHR